MVQHVDPEVLALWALGEPDVATPVDRAHLDTCAVCRSERDALAATVETARAAEPLVAPPPVVWERVRAQVATEIAAPGPVPAPGASDDAARSDGVVDLAARRRQRRPLAWASAAAGVALLAGVAGGVVWERGRETAPAPAPPALAVATAALEALPDWPGSTGSATVEQDGDGAREVVVRVSDAEPTDDGYREVWLLAADLSGMVSLGVLEGDEGTFPVPDGLDLATYSVVDVSSEPFDGDPVHSGDSIVRGALEPA
jgi:hypothetical protein